jgi:diguanylate cyclase (GGDEF)-like protein
MRSALRGQIAGVIDNGMRKNIDLAVRYGGEEFALLLPETEISEAFLAAERLRRAIAAIGQAHPASNHGVVTVSIGVAAMVPVRDKTGDELVARADAALYAAKAAGRNTVCGDRQEAERVSVPLVA